MIGWTAERAAKLSDEALVEALVDTSVRSYEMPLAIERAILKLEVLKRLRKARAK